MRSTIIAAAGALIRGNPASPVSDLTGDAVDGSVTVRTARTAGTRYTILEGTGTVAVTRTPLSLALGEQGSEPVAGGSAAAGTRLAATITRRLRIALPAINVLEAAVTFVFITYVVPLPGGAPPAAARSTALLATVVLVGACWLVCDRWGARATRPVGQWLERGGQPTPSERLRTLRLPLHEAGQVFAIWAAGGAASCVFDIAVGGSVAAGVLVGIMVLLGGLVASALCYLATERIMRPATALALASDPPTRPLVPGIGPRLFLAWEFGTAVAIGGAVVVAVAYLSGAGMSTERMAATVIFLGVVALTVGPVTLLFAIRSVVDPVRAMRGAMRRVEAGETDVAVQVDDGSEIGLLQAGFNRMVAGLRERDRVRDLFGATWERRSRSQRSG